MDVSSVSGALQKLTTPFSMTPLPLRSPSDDEKADGPRAPKRHKSGEAPLDLPPEDTLLNNRMVIEEMCQLQR